MVPDVLGLRRFMTTLNRFGCCLIPEARAEPRSVHDISLEALTTEFGPAMSTVDLCELRQLWPPSLLSAMLKRQTELESQRRECKRRLV